MWIAKGTLLALWLFGFGTMAWLYFAVYRRMPPNSAVSVHVITSYTTLNPLWWTALVSTPPIPTVQSKLPNTGPAGKREVALARLVVDQQARCKIS